MEQALLALFVAHATVTLYSASDIEIAQVKCSIHPQNSIAWSRGTAKVILSYNINNDWTYGMQMAIAAICQNQ